MNKTQCIKTPENMKDLPNPTLFSLFNPKKITLHPKIEPKSPFPPTNPIKEKNLWNPFALKTHFPTKPNSTGTKKRQIPKITVQNHSQNYQKFLSNVQTQFPTKTQVWSRIYREKKKKTKKRKSKANTCMARKESNKNNQKDSVAFEKEQVNNIYTFS